MDATTEKPRYRVKELSLVGQGLVQPGTEIEIDDLPGDNWEPLNDAARARFAEAAKGEAARVALLEKTYGNKGLGGELSADALAKAIVTAVNEANASLREEIAALRAQLEAKGPTPDEPKF